MFKITMTQTGDELMDAMLKAVEDNLRERLETARCPVHGEPLHEIHIELDGDNYKFSLKACCEAMKEDCVRALKGEP